MVCFAMVSRAPKFRTCVDGDGKGRSRQEGTRGWHKAEMRVCVSVFMCLCFSLSCEDGTNVRDGVQLQPRGPPSGVSVRVLRSRAILHAHSMAPVSTGDQSRAYAASQAPAGAHVSTDLLLQLFVVRLVRFALYPLLHAHAQSARRGPGTHRPTLPPPSVGLRNAET